MAHMDLRRRRESICASDPERALLPLAQAAAEVDLRESGVADDIDEGAFSALLGQLITGGNNREGRLAKMEGISSPPAGWRFVSFPGRVFLFMRTIIFTDGQDLYHINYREDIP